MLNVGFAPRRSFIAAVFLALLPSLGLTMHPARAEDIPPAVVPLAVDAVTATVTPQPVTEGEKKTSAGAPSALPKETLGEDHKDILEVQIGQQKTIPLTRLIRISVQDLSLLTIRALGDNEVTVVGMAAGETWLEIVHGERQFTALKVRVLHKDQLKAKDLSQTAGTGTSASDSSPLPASPAASATPTTPPTPTDVIPTDPPTQPRLQISVEPTFGLDTQRLLLLSNDGPDGGLVSQGTINTRRSFQVIPVSLRYQSSHPNMLQRDTWTLDIPYIRRHEESTFGGRLLESRNAGLGDIQLGFERIIPRLRQSAWDAIVGVNLQLPTGQSIYDSTANELPLGSGHYEMGGFLGVRKIADPFVLSATFGINNSLPRSGGGIRIKPGLGYSIRTGIGYALSDRWVLSEQISFARRPNSFLISSTDTQSEQIDQSYLAHSLSYNPKRGSHTMRLTFSAGLNNASTDYTLGFAIQR